MRFLHSWASKQKNQKTNDRLSLKLSSVGDLSNILQCKSLDLRLAAVGGNFWPSILISFGTTGILAFFVLSRPPKDGRKDRKKEGEEEEKVRKKEGEEEEKVPFVDVVRYRCCIQIQFNSFYKPINTRLVVGCA